jgi:RNA polymerase sigma-70 factor (ECF subfamily)
VVQDVFMKVQKSIGTFRGDASVSTWMFQITRNVVGHRRRKDRFLKWLRVPAESVARSMAAPGATPLEAVERRQAAERLYRVLDAMNEKYRTAFILFELERMSGEEIAGVMNVRIETLWTWLHRARASFFKHLERIEAEEG